LLALEGFEIIRSWQEILWPFSPLLFDYIFNHVFARIWPFQLFGLTNFIVARPVSTETVQQQPSVSVVIPARNEAGNISSVYERLPHMGRETEIIFVEGHSQDETYKTIQKTIERHPEWPSKLLKQNGVGKADAVRLGFENAQGDVLMILDADLTVPPEYLPRFFNALVSGKGEFINGIRLVYPMEGNAMRWANLLGNKFFSLAFSWLLDQQIKDTLCGTKVLWRSNYEMIASNREYFGDFDPFGDYDLLFGAAKLNLKIVGLPIRYRDRTYGDTNIQRWKHGLLLLRMVWFALKRLKFA